MSGFFYYDQILNNDANTFSIYKYSGGGVLEGDLTNAQDSGTVTELIRGVSRDDPMLDIAVQWGQIPTLMTSISAEIDGVVSNTAITWDNLVTRVKELFGNNDGVRSWNQTAVYNINEATKTFKGVGSDVPLNRRFSVYPYVDSKGNYVTVQDQLQTMLDAVYIKTAVYDNEVPNTSLPGFIESIFDFIKENVSDGKAKVLHYSPPHDYEGPPDEFLIGKWMTGTLALRVSDRWLYNLLLSRVQVTASRWNVEYNGTTSVMSATVDMNFIPAVAITPADQMNYLFKDSSYFSES